MEDVTPQTEGSSCTHRHTPSLLGASKIPNTCAWTDAVAIPVHNKHDGDNQVLRDAPQDLPVVQATVHAPSGLQVLQGFGLQGMGQAVLGQVGLHWNKWCWGGGGGGGRVEGDG